MDSDATTQVGSYRGSSGVITDEEELARRRSEMYRRGSNMSEASFLTDVEMAQDEVGGYDYLNHTSDIHQY